jgi:glycosyltransferase involved in cell wall biosynthesis
MKVLILHTDLRVYWNRRIHFLRDYLAACGVELYAVEIFGKGSPYDFDPFSRTDNWWDCLFPTKGFGELSQIKIKVAVFKKLKKVNPDVVIAGSIVFSSGALGLRWAKRNRKKFIMFDDAKPSRVQRNRFVQSVKNLITEQVDALWLPSDEYDGEWGALYDKEKIHFFYGFDCIDNDLFKPKEEKRLDYNKIICVSRLVEKKNIPVLLDSWKLIEQNNDVYKLSIVGDGPMLNKLIGYAKSLGLKRVEFVGAVPNEQLPKYLHEADAFILPSLDESWGLVVNEAMAAGLPVLLTSKINAAATLLKDGVNGYFINVDNPTDMKLQLLVFINLPLAAKKEMSDNSLKIIGQMDFQYMGNQLLETLKLMASEPPKKLKFLAHFVINLWYGQFNTRGWDKPEKSALS